MFKNAGSVSNALPGSIFHGRKVLVSSDGTILITGFGTLAEQGVARYAPAAMRLLADGQRDSSFSSDGFLVEGANVGMSPYSIVASTTELSVGGGVLQADGKLLLAGNGIVDTTYGVWITRYNTDGSIDTTYGDGGRVKSVLPNGNFSPAELLMQADGKLVLMGYGIGQRGSHDFAITRFNADGTPDSSFNWGLPVTLDFTPLVENGSGDVSYGMTQLSNGDFIITGKSTVNGESGKMALARIGGNGTGGSDWGNDGKVITTVFDSAEIGSATDILELADGKLLVAGNVTKGTLQYAVLVRYLADGSLDTTFGGDGKLEWSKPNGIQMDFQQMVQLADGTIIVAGNYGSDFAIYAFSSDGFAYGAQQIAVGTGAKVHSIAVQADGKILVGGESTVVIGGVTETQFSLVRFNADFSVDTSFSNTLESDQSFALAAGQQNLVLSGSDAIDGTGNALHNHVTGNAAANVLDGGDGNDVLDGGAGADTLVGGNGDDFYVVDDAGDTVIENGAANDIDSVRSSVSFVLAAELEHLQLTGYTAINGTGNDKANNLIGNNGANTLDGGAGDDLLDGALGADTLIGGDGADIYFVDNVGDVVVEAGTDGAIDRVVSRVSFTLGDGLEELTISGANTTGTGNALDNTLTSLSITTLVGGAGNDIYVIRNTLTKIIETNADPAEYDRVFIDNPVAGTTFVLAANVEEMTLRGNAAINATGNAAVNKLNGNSAANYIDGGAGADILAGGAGNDVYIVDNVGDVVIEDATNISDIDEVKSSVTYALGDWLEKLTLTGTAALDGTGNALNNTLTGNSGINVLNGGDGDDILNAGLGNDILFGGNGNDSLTGGSGADQMTGGAGNDSYVVDNVGDVVTEDAIVGDIDTVTTTINNYVLAANVERMVIGSTGALNVTGNALGNTITGNAGANIINGGEGADYMDGGVGADTYVVDNVGDVVVDTAIVSADIDTVQSSVDFKLHISVENLTLTGNAVSGIGNAQANVLTGNAADNVLFGDAGNDTLNGGVGADTMEGGVGSDAYWVDNVGDIVIEGAGSDNYDIVNSTITYTLGDNVERLTLQGTTAIDGTGNALDNVITGNNGANVLNGGIGKDTLVGGAGNDILIGGAGQDTLTGGTGSDRFVFGSYDDLPTFTETITDFKLNDVDKIDLSGLDANANIAGDQAFAYVTAFSTTDATGQVRFANGVVYISTDADSAAEYFISLTGVTLITAASFIL